jgi:hypothetical protein
MDRRVLQADVSEGGIGLAHLYPAREESICLLLATMDIRAHPISSSARSDKSPWQELYARQLSAAVHPSPIPLRAAE